MIVSSPSGEPRKFFLDLSCARILLAMIERIMIWAGPRDHLVNGE